MKTRKLSIEEACELSKRERLFINEDHLEKELKKKGLSEWRIERMLLVRYQYQFCLNYYPELGAVMKEKDFAPYLELMREYEIDSISGRYNHKTLKAILLNETIATTEEVKIFLACELFLIKRDNKIHLLNLAR